MTQFFTRDNLSMEGKVLGARVPMEFSYYCGNRNYRDGVIGV